MEGATASAPMDIDAAAPPAGAAAKSKAPLSATGRAAPWVEKYRPQSLADVAAHRDIVDTSK
jgi:replication factor C subunit 3/5